MAKPELGLKRQCMSCGAKFYDLMKDPAICPKCGTVFQMAVPGSTRVAAPAVAARPAPPDDEAEPETGDAEMVSLEEVEAEENAGEDTADEEGEGGTPRAEDDTFLEEEGNDDVSDLIDNDIENEDEER